MGISISLHNRRIPMINPSLFAKHPRDLIEEIAEYKRETERLGKIYDLHRQLSTTLDLDAMIETFSRWLAPMTPHHLVAYRHFGRKRIHIACSAHGPLRLQMQAAAYELMIHPVDGVIKGDLSSINQHFHLWSLNSDHNDSLLILHPRPDVAAIPFCNFETEILHELRGPLKRALAYDDLYDQARRDLLTGLVNRRVFEERAIMEMANAHRSGHPLALACMDLDHFKAINDCLGHGKGDEVLQTVSQTFARTVRDSDLLARVGGDEFAMILPNTSLENAGLLMERLCRAIRDLNISAPDTPSLGVSVGIALWSSNDSMEHWWHLADAALYRAKSKGRSQVCF